jgi:hypothetical protein
MGRWLCDVLINLKENLFLFLDLLGTVAEVLTMCCFFDKYGRGVGSYSFFRLLEYGS